MISVETRNAYDVIFFPVEKKRRVYLKFLAEFNLIRRDQLGCFLVRVVAIAELCHRGSGLLKIIKIEILISLDIMGRRAIIIFCV